MVHEIWKIQYQFADAKIDLRDGARPDSHVTALWAVHIVKNDIFSALSFYKHWFLSLNPRGYYSRFLGEELRGIFYG